VSDDEGLRLKDAVIHIAAAQIKAVAIAIAAGAEVPTPDSVDGDRGWGMEHGFTAHDAIAALGGVSSLLGNLTDIIMEVGDAEPTAESEAAE